MFCTNCGNLLKDGALFCSKCGRKIKRSQPAAASPDFNQTENVIVSGTATVSASEMSAAVKKQVVAPEDAFSILIGFRNFLEKEKNIPQYYPKEEDYKIQPKDIAICVAIGAAITIFMLVCSVLFLGISAGVWDFIQCVAFFGAIAFGITWLKRKIQYERDCSSTEKKRERMLDQLDRGQMQKYQYEDKILDAMNRYYGIYIGDTAFHSRAIRDREKESFLKEFSDIIKYAEENHLENMTFDAVIEKYCKNVHDVEMEKLQEKLKEIREKIKSFQKRCGGPEALSKWDEAIKRIDEIINLDVKNDASPYIFYAKSIDELSEQMTKMEVYVSELEKEQEKEWKALQDNIPSYQEELKKLIFWRKKYDDKEFSSYFLKDFHKKLFTLQENLKVSASVAKAKASRVESEIQQDIENLKRMVEKEAQSRHRKIYGKRKNDMAIRFKALHR